MTDRDQDRTYSERLGLPNRGWAGDFPDTEPEEDLRNPYGTSNLPPPSDRWVNLDDGEGR